MNTMPYVDTFLASASALPFRALVKLGNGTALTMATWRDQHGLHVAIQKPFESSRVGGYFTFASRVTLQYIQEKFNLPEPDAYAVGKAINTALGY